MNDVEIALARFFFRVLMAATEIEHRELTESREPLHSSDWIARQALQEVLTEDVNEIQVSAFARELDEKLN